MSKSLFSSVKFANQLVIIIIILEVVDSLTFLGLDRFGIRPWSLIGLIGVVFAPLLHYGWDHLMTNTIPLWVNTVILFSEKKFRPEWTFGVIWIASGLGTWLIGGLRSMDSIHLGASSVIFGLVCYLILMGIFLGRFLTILVSFIVLFFFGGILSGILPNPEMPQVSWEAHFSGAMSGTFAAIYNKFFRKSS